MTSHKQAGGPHLGRSTNLERITQFPSCGAPSFVVFERAYPERSRMGRALPEVILPSFQF